MNGYDLSQDPFVESVIDGPLCATYEWRIANEVDTKTRALCNLLVERPIRDLLRALRKAGFDARLELSDKVFDYRRFDMRGGKRGNSYETHSMRLPFPIQVPQCEGTVPRAYVLRTDSDELALQEHHQGQRPAFPGISKPTGKGFETLRCSLRCYGEREPRETGAFAQRIKIALERLYRT